MTFNSALHALLRRSRTAVKYGRKNGFGALAALTKQKLHDYRYGGLLAKTRLIDFYEFVKQGDIGAPIVGDEVPRTTINWVVPPFGYGSGGHLNIFRFVYQLESMGFDCRIVVVGEPQPLSADQAQKQIRSWFFPLKGRVYLGMESVPPAHITVATGWNTAYFVRRFLSTRHRCYFVQDYEPYFYAVGSEHAWAEETYRFGFVGITAGSWLKEKLASDFGMRTESFGFSYDRELYSPRARNNPEALRVFFYARPPTQRRAFELGLMVLDEVTRRLPDVEVVFAGWDVSEFHIPFRYKNAGILPVDELPDLYSQCDVALVLSFTNLSLLPLELMACGTPVVSNRAPCTEWLLNDDNARLSAPTVEALTDAICSTLSDPVEAERLRRGGLATAALTDWNVEAKRVAGILRRLDAEEVEL